MTVASTTRKTIPVVGNDLATVFAFAFKVFAKADLQVNTTVLATGIATTLLLDSDYSVVLNADQDNNPGGSITYPLVGPPMSGTTELQIVSNVVMTQGLNLPSGGGAFNAHTIEDSLDKAIIGVQQITELGARSLTFPPTDVNPGQIPGSAQRAGKFLAFDGSGNPIATFAAFAISNAMAPVVAASSIAAALALLTVAGIAAMGGPLLFTPDNTYDIGAAGASRPRAGYFGTRIITPILDSGAAAAISIKTNLGTEQVRIGHTANAVNFWLFTGSAGTGPIDVSSQGTAADVVMQYSAKGDGGYHSFRINGGTSLIVSGAASVVNRVQIFGGATTVFPTIAVFGSDTNPGLNISAQGTGAINFQGNGTQFRIRGDLAAVNFFDVFGAVGGGSPQIRSEGSDANISAGLYSKGTGSVVFATGQGARIVLQLNNIVSSVNYWTMYPSATAIDLVLQAEGTDANVGVQLRSKGTSALTFATGQGARVGLKIIDITSSVIFLQINPGPAGGRIGLFSLGDANAGALLSANGAGDVLLMTGAGTRTGFQLLDAASSVNWLTVTPGATGVRPTLGAAGEANVGLSLTSKGTGDVVISTSGNAHAVIQCLDAASAVNWLTITPSATTAAVTLSVNGSDGNIQLNIKSKGTSPLLLASAGAGGIALYTNHSSTPALQVEILHIATAVNRITLQGSATLTACAIAVQGSDGNIALQLWGKGSGEVAVITVTGNFTVYGDNAGSAPMFTVLRVASVVNYVQISGAAAGANASIKTNAENLLFGSGAALAVGATAGYVMIPSCAGTPTGVPTGNGAGKIAMQYDTTANKIWFYNGAWRGVLVA